MELKKGDKIRLISAKDEEEYYKKFIGKIFTVRRITGDYVVTNEDSINPYIYNIEKVVVLNEYDFANAPIGTKLTFRDGEVLIKNGYDFYENKVMVRTSDTMILSDIIKIEEPQYNTIYEHKPEILDKDDKRYIKSVIRPFRDKVKYITKRSRYLGLGKEFISITLNDNFIINLPFFAKGTMYDNMEVDKLYTLEDLNI